MQIKQDGKLMNRKVTINRCISFLTIKTILLADFFPIALSHEIFNSSDQLGNLTSNYIVKSTCDAIVF